MKFKFHWAPCNLSDSSCFKENCLILFKEILSVMSLKFTIIPKGNRGEQTDREVKVPEVRRVKIRIPLSDVRAHHLILSLHKTPLDLKLKFSLRK